MADPRDPLVESLPAPSDASSEETLDLLRRARTGSAWALNKLFQRHEEAIYRIVRVRLGRRLRRVAESGDIVQETCRAALAGLSSVPLEGEFDFVHWLSRIATQRIRDLADHAGATKRELARTRPLQAPSGSSDHSRHLAASGITPGEQAWHAELRALLDELVASLPPRYRDALLLRDYEGADWQVVADAIGAPSVHAAQQLHQRAWIRLRSLAAPRLRNAGPE